MKQDEAFKAVASLFFGKELALHVETDFELFNIPKRLDILVIKGAYRPQELEFFSYFKNHNLISFKSITDRFKIDHFLEGLFYVPAYMSRAEVHDFDEITFSLISAYSNKKIIRDYKLEKLEPGIYTYRYLEVENRFIFLSEIKLKDQFDLLLLMLFAGRRKLSEALKYVLNFSKLSSRWLTYFKFLLFSSQRDDLKEIATREEFKKTIGGMNMSITETLAENLTYLKSLGFNVKTFEDYKEEGFELGRQKGIEKGIEIGKQKALKEVLVETLEARFDNIDLHILKQIQKLNDLTILKLLIRRAQKVKNIKEFEEILKNFVKK